MGLTLAKVGIEFPALLVTLTRDPAPRILTAAASRFLDAGAQSELVVMKLQNLVHLKQKGLCSFTAVDHNFLEKDLFLRVAHTEDGTRFRSEIQMAKRRVTLTL